MRYIQTETTLQPIEETVTAVSVPFMTVSDEDNAYALKVAPNSDSAVLPNGIENGRFLSE